MSRRGRHAKPRAIALPNLSPETPRVYQAMMLAVVIGSLVFIFGFMWRVTH